MFSDLRTLLALEEGVAVAVEGARRDAIRSGLLIEGFSEEDKEERGDGSCDLAS